MSPPPSPLSDSDNDYGFEEDMEALRRACTITSRNPGAADAGEESDPDISAGSTDNDLDLLHRVQERFSIPASSAEPLSVVTHTFACRTSDSDNDDDLETLRAIQQRFQRYESDAVYMTSGNHLEEDAAVPTAVTTGRETLDTLSKSRKCITPSEELPDFATTGSHHAEDMHNSSAKTLVYSQFSNSALYIVEALRKNRSCQKFMRRKLIEIESKIGENKELRGRIKCLMDFQAACNRKTGRMLCQEKDPRVRLISSRKSRTDTPKNRWKKFPALYFGPAENSHVSKYRMTMERFPISLRKLPWSNIENDNLVKGLKQQYQEMVMLNLLNIESGLGSSGDTNSGPAVSSSDYEVTSEKIRSFLPLVNWDRLASMYLTGRSGAECESRWLNCLDPSVNFSPWSIEEDKKLLYIVQKRGIFNWIDIAIGMGNFRTPFQCLLRYQRSLNPHILNRDWTKEDDTKLRLAVEAFGYDWQVVASNVEGRSGPQCSNRWRQCLHPERKKVGRWSVDEDKFLKVAVMLFGAKNWNKIALFTSGRTQAQCRERWLNCLDPSLNLEPWTQEEDDKLLAALLKHGHSWSKVAACVPPRTDNQCRRRWKVLRPHEVPLLQATKKIKRTVLISNFVGRESERPLIGPSDFSVPALPAAEDANNKADRKKTSSCDLSKKSKAKPKKSLKIKSEADGMVNSSSEIAPGDPSLIPGVNSTTGEVGSFKRIRKETLRDTEPKGSTAKSIGSLDESVLVDGVNSSSGTASGDLFVVPTVNTTNTERASTSGTKKKTSSSDLPKMYRAKSGTSLEENLNADAVIKSPSEAAPDDLSCKPCVDSAATETKSPKRTIKRIFSTDLPKTSRAKSGSSIEEKLNVNAIIKSPLSSDNLHIISGDKYGGFLEEKVTSEAMINSSSGVALGDIPCVSSAVTDSGSLKRSRKKTSRSRAKSGSSLGETLTVDAMKRGSSDVPPDNKPDDKIGSSFVEDTVTDAMIYSSSQTARGSLSLSLSDVNFTSTISGKRTRKRKSRDEDFYFY